MADFSPSGDLQQIGVSVWGELVRAVHLRDHAWRHAAMATLCPVEGPQVRTVVLREVDPAQRELLVYTDTRSPKVAQLAQDARASLVCWSAALGWQVRLGAVVEVCSDGLDVTSRWALLKHTRAAQDYLSPLGPGQVLTTGVIDSSAAGEPRAHFALMRIRVLTIDWLALDPQGHRRALFDYRDGAAPPHWLTP